MSALCRPYSRAGAPKPRAEEGVKRLRLVRMEEIADRDRAAERAVRPR